MTLRLKDTGNNSGRSNELNLLGEGTYLEGKIESKGSIRIDGKVKGTVITSDILTIGSKGYVSGKIEAQEAIVGGKIEGDIKASEKLILEANSTLVGNIETKKLVIDEGAIFQGKSDMGVTSSEIEYKHPLKQEKKEEKGDKIATG